MRLLSHFAALVLRGVLALFRHRTDQAMVGIPVPRQVRPGDSLRAHLHGAAKDQPEQGLRQANRGHPGLVSFLDFDLGFFDRHEGRVKPAPNPFEPEKVLTMSPE